MKLRTCVLLVLVPSMVLCQLMSCPDRSTLEDFEFSLYQGHWYTLMRTGVADDSKCQQQIIQEESQNSSVIIFKVANPTDTDYSTTTYEGVIWQTDSPGKLQFTVPDIFRGLESAYWILDTDYENYAVIYTCWHYAPVVFREYATVLGRSTNLSVEAQAAVDRTLENNNFIPDQLLRVSHSGCE